MLNKKYQNVDNAIASYDFYDIAAGTGITKFYAGRTADKNLLSNQQFYSDPIFTSGSIIGGSGSTLLIEYDFDVLINRPWTIRGSVVLNVPVAISGDASTKICYVEARVRKWDGANEIEIAANSGSSWNMGGTAWTYKMFAIDLDIPTTTFKAGEYLRLTTNLYAESGVTNAHFAIAYDPMNRSAGWDSTGAVPSSLIFQVPTRIDV